MGDTTGIGWCDCTHNEWRGCTQVSRACKRCYAKELAKRNPSVLGQWGVGKPRVLGTAAYRRHPFLWEKLTSEGLFRECPSCRRRSFRKWISEGRWFTGCPTKDKDGVLCNEEGIAVRPRVFTLSLGDWLDAEVDVAWLGGLIDTVRLTPHLNWLMLTKRPELWRPRLEAVRDWAGVPGRWDLHNFVHLWLDGIYDAPPHNVIVGATVEDQANAIERLPHLLKIRAAARFLSCEPLAGPIDFLKVSAAWSAAGMDARTHPWSNTPVLHGIDQIITGGESGRESEPSHPDWFRSLRDQARQFGKAFFFKQRGDWTWCEEKGDNLDPVIPEGWREHPEKVLCLGRDGKPADGYNGSGAEFMVRVGKNRAGNCLDGQLHEEYPRVLLAAA